MSDIAIRVTAWRVRKVLHGMLLAAEREGPIYGVGGTVKGVPVIRSTAIAPYLACVCEVPGGGKIGQNIPGTRIPVVDEAKLIDDSPPYAVMLAWDIANQVWPRLRQAGYRGRFIVPLPEPRVF